MKCVVCSTERLKTGHVFCNSELYHKVYNGTLLQGHSRSINGVNVPVFLVGDAGYPLLYWLLKPYPFHSTLSAAQKTFNYRTVES